MCLRKFILKTISLLKEKDCFDFVFSSFWTAQFLYIFTPSLDTDHDSRYVLKLGASLHTHMVYTGCSESNGGLISPLNMNDDELSAPSSALCRSWQAASVNFGSGGQRRLLDEVWLQCVHSRSHSVLELEAADWLPRSVCFVTSDHMFSLSGKWKMKHTYAQTLIHFLSVEEIFRSFT